MQPFWMVSKILNDHPRALSCGHASRTADAQRGSDAEQRGDSTYIKTRAVKMGRQHIQSGVLAIRQGKTGTVVEIPVLPELQTALDMLPAGQLTFLMTDFGKAFSAAGVGNWFRRMCVDAG